MQTLVQVLELVRDARQSIECGRVNDAAWLLEAVEEDLENLVLAACCYAEGAK